jgi:exopolysaccharide biosynthesis polyprenyl glycosylphosphotransferase
LKQFSKRFILFLLVSDILLTLLALYMAEVVREIAPFGSTNTGMTFLSPAIVPTVALTWGFFLRFFGAYDPRRLSSFVEEGRAITLAILAGMLVLSSFFYLFNIEYRSRMLFAYFAVIDLLLLVNYRLVVRYLVRSMVAGGYNVRRVVIVGTTKVARDLTYLVGGHPWTGLSVVGFVDDDPLLQGGQVEERPVLGTTKQLQEIIERYSVDEVIVALPGSEHEKTTEIVLSLYSLPVRVRIVPDLFEMVSVRAQVEDFWGIPLIGLRDPVIAGFDRSVKRAFDLAIASLMVMLLSPVMLAVAVAIKLDSRGPVIFKQQRVGENGKPFWMYKFRTMAHGADQLVQGLEEDGTYTNGVYKVREDRRVTGVGRFLRRMSLDELPQLFNVLKGDLSLVGPRPELPEVVADYEPWQHGRHRVKPGVTGLWQVTVRADGTPMHHHVATDIEYVRRLSFRLDAWVLIATVPTVLGLTRADRSA